MELLNSAEGSKSLFAYNSYLNTSYTSTYLYPQSSYTCKASAGQRRGCRGGREAVSRQLSQHHNYNNN